MRITVDLDDALFQEARTLAEPGVEDAELLRQSLSAFIRQQSARRLASLGGQAPDMGDVPRRREEDRG